ncbi:MAG: hypothetical protein MUF52_12315 [Syntrophobacteraceae bacterium]|nr:hypothetical protein [Syntrophobacteraceae bacterium]
MLESHLLPGASPRAPVAAAATAGLASALGQILVVRELLVLFHGNELTTGLVLTAWLLWTAAGCFAGGRWSSRRRMGAHLLPATLWAQALLLPGAVLFIRSSRLVWSIPAGEVFPMGIMLVTILVSTSLFCIAGGILFSAAWSLACVEGGSGRSRPLGVYVAEALGSAVGGLVAHYSIVPRMDGCDAAFATGSILFLAGSFLMPRSPPQGGPSGLVFKLLGLLLAAGWVAAPNLTSLTHSSHRWNWGDRLAAVENTPYNHLALLRNDDQLSVFGNGLWFFSIPDPQTAELAVHIPLLQHREPRRILLLGGGMGGEVREALKHPTVERIDLVEPDPGVLPLLRRHVSGPALDWTEDPRASLLPMDVGAFIRRARTRYDVILVQVGEPVNASMNRFYTVELYGRLRGLMEPGAILALGLPSAPDAMGEAQLRYLTSVHETLHAVFPHVLVLPGDTVRLLAAPDQGTLSADPRLLTTRISERGLALTYVQPYMLHDLMSVQRLSYMRSLLAAEPAPRINRDFTPICYFNALRVWTSQAHPAFGNALSFLARGAERFPMGLFAMGALALPLALAWKMKGRRSPVRLAVAVTGGSLMVVEIVLLLAFQILEGFLYSELAVILASFMTGMAAGAAVAGSWPRELSNPLKSLITVHFGVAVHVLAVMLAIFTLHRLGSWPAYPNWVSLAVFRGLALTAGGMAGAHFALATAVQARERGSVAGIGAGLYAADLTGASLGAIASSLVLLPLLGVQATLALTTGALVCLGVMLLRSQGTGMKSAPMGFRPHRKDEKSVG